MIVYLDYDEQVGEWYVTLENNEGDMIEVFTHFDRDCALAVANKYVDAGCATLVDGCEIIPYDSIS